MADLVIRRIKSFELYKDARICFQLQITTFNDVPYLAFVKFWFDSKTQNWVQTKKQGSVPAHIWPKLIILGDEVSEILQNLNPYGTICFTLLR